MISFEAWISETYKKKKYLVFTHHEYKRCSQNHFLHNQDGSSMHIYQKDHPYKVNLLNIFLA